MTRFLRLFLCLAACGGPLARAQDAQRLPAEGQIRFEPSSRESEVPSAYRLQAADFPYKAKRLHGVEGAYTVYGLQFSSPVKSPFPENNTVHARYYLPEGKGPFAATVVLDILAGSETIPRLMCDHLARGGVAALHVQMPYYGPRKPKNAKVKMLSSNLLVTLPAIRQAVLDLRVANAWLRSRPEVDASRLGISGTSLGSLVSALTGAVEERYRKVVILLGGGGFVDAYYSHPQAREMVKSFEANGGTKEMAAYLFAPYDPITWAARLAGRDVLIMAGKQDEVILPEMTVKLWEKAGKPEIVWFDCTHLGAVRFLPDALNRISKHMVKPCPGEPPMK
jgi:dienelactone hydrolase